MIKYLSPHYLNSRHWFLVVDDILHENSKVYWKCICVLCKKEIIRPAGQIVKGFNKSCGCLKLKSSPKNLEKALIKVTVHGKSRNGDLTYTSWKSMIGRCKSKALKQYSWYGGRGITVCERWLESRGLGFLNFLEDMGERPSREYSLDRINNDLGYYKENCRWASKSQQNNNRRVNIKIEYKGKIRTLKEWSKELNISYYKLRYRFRVGKPVEELFYEGRLLDKNEKIS